GWQLDDVHSAHIDRGKEPGDVADYAAPERDQRDSAIGALPDEFSRQLLQRGEALRALAIGHLDEAGFDSRSRQGLQQDLCPAPAYGRHGDHECTAVLENLA